MALADGVLPDPVIRDERAESLLLFLDLDPGLDAAGVQAWLQALTALVRDLVAERGGQRYASAAVGLGAPLVQRLAAADTALAERVPAGLRSPLAVPGVADPAVAARDVCVYVMATSEAVVAHFLTRLSGTRAQGLRGVHVERGFQTSDGRELFGNRDGLRNVARADRHRVVFVDRDRLPEEPAWCEDGTYLAYVKTPQQLDAWERLPPDARGEAVGRRVDDGSRLDLPAGSDPRAEGPFAASDNPSPTSHVRKTGPRGADHQERVQVFRRGTPYLGVRPDGSLDAGLHFVSFQATLDAVDVVLNRWMLNPNFPQPGSGPDQLLHHNLISVAAAGFYFVPPSDERFLGAGLFDQPEPEAKPRKEGYLHVRKRAVDASGTPRPAEVGGVAFQVFRASGEPVGDPFTTDSAGHATSPPLPLGQPLTLRETPPTHLAAADRSFTLTRKRQVERVDDQLAQPGGPGYGG